MHTPNEMSFFLEQGYLHVPGVLDGDHLRRVQAEFDRVWDLEGPPANQHKLLKYPLFMDLIEHEPILNRHKAVFRSQVQLLQYDVLRQGPQSGGAARSWHRDFVFPGNRPLSINTIQPALYCYDTVCPIILRYPTRASVPYAISSGVGGSPFTSSQ